MEQSKKAATQNVGIRLIAKGTEDVPVTANFARVQVSSPLLVIDFGFVEPMALNAMSSALKSGHKLPESMDGRLAARVALTPDAMVALHQQLSQTLAVLQQQVGEALAGLKGRKEETAKPE